MYNTYKIAKKEYIDLISNPMVIIILISFIILICCNIFEFSYYLNLAKTNTNLTIPFNGNIGIFVANNLLMTLTRYSTIVGIIIGCSIISSERAGKAINTLITKPIYRDTIINGKLLGSLAFLASVMVFVIALNTAVLMVVRGSSLAPFLSDYVSRIPFIFAFAMVYVAVFLSVSMLISLLIRSQSFAMILSLFTVLVSDMMNNINFALCLDNLFPGNGIGQLCVNLSPTGVLYWVLLKFFNSSTGVLDAFVEVMVPEMQKFLIYTAIALLFSYILFIKRDIS